MGKQASDHGVNQGVYRGLSIKKEENEPDYIGNYDTIQSI